MTSEARPFPLADEPNEVKRLSWLRAARVGHWAHFLVLPLGGFELTLGLPTFALARGVLIAFLVLAFGYWLNGIADRHMDAGSGKNPLTAVEPSLKHHGAVVALAAGALGLALTGPLAALLATITCLVSGVVYSIGPRLKRVPIVGTLLNASNFAPLLWVGVGPEPVLGLPHITLVFTALLLQNQLLHEAADREEDRRGDVRTTFLVLGRWGVAVLAIVLGAVLAVTAAASPALAWLTWPLALVYAAAVPLALAARGEDAEAMGRARLGHRFFSIATGALVFASVRL